MPESVALVFSGGVGLGSYQAGAYARLVENAPQYSPTLYAGSSIGAVNAAIVLGSRSDRRIDNLREFWSATNLFVPPLPWSRGRHWVSAMQARIFGVHGHFRPRVSTGQSFSSLYDLSPMRRRLEGLIDFGQLNAARESLCVAATDVNYGKTVIFYTRRQSIEMDHLLASCGFIPEFAPVCIEDALLGDGGLSANAPVEAALFENVEKIFVADLFARDGLYSADLETALARKDDIMYGNQTVRALELVMRERSRSNPSNTQCVYYLSYRPSPSEAGPGRLYDLSPESIWARWQAGAIDMDKAVALAAASTEPGLHFVR